MNINRSAKELMDLKYENCVEKLTTLDWEILFQSYEEMYRRGNYERVFPPNNINEVDYYGKFFEYPRHNNIVLWQALKSKKCFLDKITKQIYFD